MVTFMINFQAEGTNSRSGDKILIYRMKIAQNALDSMAMSPDRENVSIFENYPQLS